MYIRPVTLKLIFNLRKKIDNFEKQIHLEVVSVFQKSSSLSSVTVVNKHALFLSNEKNI